MKRFWLLTTLLFGGFLFAGCTSTVQNPEINVNENEAVLEEVANANEAEEVSDTTEDSKSLVIYFSPTWNTKRAATIISETIGADIVEIVPETPYTEEDLNWMDRGSRSTQEHNDTSIRPEIASEISFDGYDTIYLGYPIWFGVTPNIILTLLDNYDLSGKNVVLFCTSTHVWIESSVEYLNPYNLNIVASKRFEENSPEEEIQEWANSL